ncbi:MAG: ARC6/PARC6 family protein, partial [Elainellaceae cyanobacterium]
QLRSYLTVAEQQTLFEREAKRPSAVAAYLAVYALIAGGFAYQQPTLIHQARSLLVNLSARQDVSLERAICALLLGQTDEAGRVVEQSQETEALNIIRRRSQDSPDLLPGLCFYTERWLQKDVFPFFRDLASQPTSLKFYFADPTVQAYLEDLPAAPEVAMPWSTVQSPLSGSPNGTSPTTALDPRRSERSPAHASVAASASRRSETTSSMQVAERVSRKASARSRRSRTTTGARGTPPTTRLETQGKGSGLGKRSPRNSGPRLDRLLLLGGAVLLGLILLWIVLNRFFTWVDQRFATPFAGEQLEIGLTQPVVTIPDPPAPIQNEPAPDGELTQPTAESVIQSWFAAKGEALGEAHNVEALSRILTGDLLARWEGQAAIAASDGWYWDYDYPNVEVLAVDWSDQTPDLASVDVAVTEDGTFHTANGVAVPEESYTTELQVRYSLVREDNQWKVEAIEIL